MPHNLKQITKQNLSDDLALSIKEFIVSKNYACGDRLPTTAELASRFGVGHPTLREAIKKLATIGVVEVKHGSGIYVGEHVDSLFFLNPITQQETPSKKSMLDLIEARILIESETAGKAAENIQEVQIKAMRNLLQTAKEKIEDDNILNKVNMGFHREIALASGNTVLHQILGVMTNLYQKEQRLILHIYRSKERDHMQHMQIFEALKNRDSREVVRLMKAHLEEVRRSIEMWHPDDMI